MIETLIFMGFCIAIWALIGISMGNDDLASFWPQKEGAGRFAPKKKAAVEALLPKTPDELRAYNEAQAKKKQLNEPEALLPASSSSKAGNKAGSKKLAAPRGQNIDAIKATANLKTILSDIRSDQKTSQEHAELPASSLNSATGTKAPKRLDISRDMLEAMRSDRPRKPKTAGVQKRPVRTSVKPASAKPKAKRSIIEASADPDSD